MPETPAAPTVRPRLHHYDLVRVLCIGFIIFVWHADDYLARPVFQNPATVLVTCLALNLFFFLSGHLLAAFNTVDTGRQALVFYRRRLLRIYPLFLSALALFAVSGNTPLVQLAHNAVLLNLVLGDSVHTLWFVTVICGYYLLLPLLARWRSALTTLAAAAAAALPLALVRAASHGALVEPRFLYFLPAFTLGVLYARHARLAAVLDNPWAGLGLLAAALGVCIPAKAAELTGVYYVASLGAVPAALDIARRLYTRPTAVVSLLSYCSYCMYLYHRAVFRTLTTLWTPPGLWPSLAWLVLAGGTCLVALSWLVQKCYDRVTSRPPAPSGDS